MYFEMDVRMREYLPVIEVTVVGAMGILDLLDSLCVGINMVSIFISCLINIGIPIEDAHGIVAVEQMHSINLETCYIRASVIIDFSHSKTIY